MYDPDTDTDTDTDTNTDTAAVMGHVLSLVLFISSIAIVCTITMYYHNTGVTSLITTNPLSPLPLLLVFIIGI